MSAPRAPDPGFARGSLFRLQEGGRSLDCAVSLVATPLATLEATMPERLAPEERALLTDRLAPARRQSFLAGRQAAKNALGLLAPDVAARDIRVLPGVLQQPVTRVPGLSNIQVTLAHSGLAAIAVAHPEACPMGVDLERAAPEPLAALREQTTPREWALARSALPGDDAERLLLLWCLKEALSKALRCGLTVPFSLLEASALVPEPSGVRARFSNFSQYEGLAFFAAPFCLALAWPHTVRWVGSDRATSPHLLRDWVVALAAGG